MKKFVMEIAEAKKNYMSSFDCINTDARWTQGYIPFEFIEPDLFHSNLCERNLGTLEFKCFDGSSLFLKDNVELSISLMRFLKHNFDPDLIKIDKMPCVAGERVSDSYQIFVKNLNKNPLTQ